MSYINISGTFYYLCSVLDGCSRYIVRWDIRESMTEADVEIIRQRAKEKVPEAKPRIISDNVPQFIARDFKEFIRISGMTHVRISPHYPQSNGKIERWHQSLKRECIRPGTPLSVDDARDIVGRYVDHYNHVRLHSAIGYVAPRDKLEGRDKELFAERDRKLDHAWSNGGCGVRYSVPNTRDKGTASMIYWCRRMKLRKALLRTNLSRDSSARAHRADGLGPGIPSWPYPHFHPSDDRP